MDGLLGLSLRMDVCSQVWEGHLVDALALRGEEGRDTLRKAPGRWE